MPRRSPSFSLARLLYLRSSTTTASNFVESTAAVPTASYRTILTPTCHNTPTLGKPIRDNCCRHLFCRCTSIAFSHQYRASQLSRNYSGDEASRKELDVNKVVDEINQKFAEAREEVEAAMDSKETVYFNEEAEIARTAVQEVLDMFEGLLGKVESKQRESLMRSMGLKIEQLKAELQQLNE